MRYLRSPLLEHHLLDTMQVQPGDRVETSLCVPFSIQLSGHSHYLCPLGAHFLSPACVMWSLSPS